MRMTKQEARRILIEAGERFNGAGDLRRIRARVFDHTIKRACDVLLAAEHSRIKAEHERIRAAAYIDPRIMLTMKHTGPVVTIEGGLY